DPNLDKDAAIAGILEDDSPYPEVRSAVANTDDPTIPVATVCAWTLGIFWAIIIPGLNQFFCFRYPAVTVTSIVAQLLTFPFGRAWARVLPNISLFGLQLNPGPFSIKEHVLITIMAGVGAGSAYATDIVAVQRVYYDQTYNFGYQWMVVMSTQLIGFSIGGIARRFLVRQLIFVFVMRSNHCSALVGASCDAVRTRRGVATPGRGGRRSVFPLSLIIIIIIWLLKTFDRRYRTQPRPHCRPRLQWRQPAFLPSRIEN
ncbi:OPT oligopeptide transporter protein-domain-containing protein, partial [Mycena leptocephala]